MAIYIQLSIKQIIQYEIGSEQVRKAITIHEYKCRYERREGMGSPGAAVSLSGVVDGRSRAPPPLHVALRNRKGGGLHGNSPPSLETGELYNFTRQYCFFTTNGFLAPPVYLSRIDSAC